MHHIRQLLVQARSLLATNWWRMADATGQRPKERYDIHKALTYCQQIITKPNDTILVLITDLYEGGDPAGMRRRMEELVASGVQLITLLALNDDGAPSFDAGNARFLAGLGVPVFACTPDQFPELMAAAISRQDLNQWAGDRDIVLKGAKGQ